MNMYSPKVKFRREFLSAAEKAAANAEHIQQLREAKTALQQDFIKEFGPDAFKKYYLGEIKKAVHEDYEYFESNDGSEDPTIIAKAPTIEKAHFNIHFPHEDIADEFGINFVTLHGPTFYPYFMAAAMHQLTGEHVYDELAGDMLEEIEIALQENIREGHDELSGRDFGPLTKGEIDFIIDALSSSITCMLQHRRPNSLRLSDTIDPNDESENPGPRPE